MAFLYSTSIAIRSLVDLEANCDKTEDDPVDEFGLTTRSARLAERKARILEDNVTLLEFISWTLQGSGFLATVGIILWIAFRSVKPLEKRLRLAYIVPTVFVIFLGCIVILACLCGVLLTTSALALERLPVGRANIHRIALYTFALTWMLAAITFYVALYNEEGTSKARVPQAFG